MVKIEKHLSSNSEVTEIIIEDLRNFLKYVNADKDLVNSKSENLLDKLKFAVNLVIINRMKEKNNLLARSEESYSCKCFLNKRFPIVKNTEDYIKVKKEFGQESLNAADDL